MNSKPNGYHHPVWEEGTLVELTESLIVDGTEEVLPPGRRGRIVKFDGTLVLQMNDGRPHGVEKRLPIPSGIKRVAEVSTGYLI